MKLLKVVDGLIIFTILILCYVIFFHDLGEYSIRLWDEGRNAVNALEMIKTKNLITTYFNGEPDLWNTKPPLHIWIVAIFFKIFGENELSLRLPSAIAATIMILAMYRFCQNYLKNRWVGILSVLIILSSMGYADTHIGRTGDYDALLVMFVFLASITSFKYLLEKKTTDLYKSGVLWGLAVLTKGVAGLLMGPGILLYVLISGNLIPLIKNKKFWKITLILILVLGGYYVTREHLNPGYMEAVLREEIIDRTTKNLGSSGNDYWYYWRLLSEFRFQKWIYFVPVSILVYFFGKKKTTKQFVVFAYLMVLSYFLIISGTKTKQIWYDAQLYPFASILVAILIVEIIGKLPFILRLFPIIVVCFYMQRYIRTNIAYINRPDLYRSEACLKYGYLFGDKEIDKTGFVGVHKADWCIPIYFYLERDGLLRKKIEEIDEGEKVLTCDSVTYNEIRDKYETEIIFDNKDGCLGFEILK